MTASPNWPEVQANLRPGEHAYNRPDLIARVFRAKLKELIKMLTVGVDGQPPVFGQPAAHTYVIEFQKRGLPHAHIWVIMENRTSRNRPLTSTNMFAPSCRWARMKKSCTRLSSAVWYTVRAEL